MFILDTLLINGIKFALDKVVEVAERELDNPESLQQQLLEAQQQLEEGTMDEEQFADIEADIFARLRDLKGSEAGGGIADASAFEEIEVDIAETKTPSATRSDHCYVYAAVESASAVMTAAGMPGGGAPRLVAIDPGISLVISDVPSSIYDADALEPRLSDLDWVSLAGAAHHAVVDSLAGAGLTVIPFRLFTIFSSEAAAIATLGDKRLALRDACSRVRNREEWVLRISKPDPSRLAAPQDEAATSRVSGTGFLQAKADARREAAARDERVKKEAAAAFAALEPLADATTTRAVDPAGRLLLDGALLVPATRVDDLRETLTASASGLLRDGCAVSLTGPWPPYSFASVDSQHDD